ncbi:MAG: hypothetical protein ACOC9T_03210 [Myxococcota bacterium]
MPETEVGYHEEELTLDWGGARVILRQVPGEPDVWLGLARAATGNPDVLVHVKADELDALAGALEGLRWARCVRCDAPVDGTEGDPSASMLCEDCLEVDGG